MTSIFISPAHLLDLINTRPSEMPMIEDPVQPYILATTVQEKMKWNCWEMILQVLVSHLTPNLSSVANNQELRSNSATYNRLTW